MRTTARAITVSVAVIAAAAGVCRQVLSATQRTVQGECAVEGVVLDTVTRRGVSGAVVDLSGPTSGKQIAESEGRFAFRGITCGSYRLTTVKPGYAAGAFGVSTPSQGAPRLVVSQGTSTRVVISMARHAELAGGVRDEQGRPIVGAFVRAIATHSFGNTQVQSAGPVATTDDLGNYALSGLTPGSYYVQVVFGQAVLPQADPAPRSRTSPADPLLAMSIPGFDARVIVGRFPVPPPASDGRLQVFRPVFYPDGQTIAEALQVSLSPGERREGVSFVLTAVPTAAVSGTLVGPPEDAAGAHLRLVLPGCEGLGDGAAVASTVSDARGVFTFLGVPQGVYVLTLSDSSSGFSYAPSPREGLALPSVEAGDISAMKVPWGPAGLMVEVRSTRPTTSWLASPVNVGRDDVSMTVSLQSGASIALELLGTGAGASGFLASRLDDGEWTAYRSRPDPNSPSRSLMTGLRPGRYSIFPMFASAESLTCDGHDLMAAPLILEEGARARCSVTLLRSQSTLEGLVNAAGSGRDASSLGVIAFPADLNGIALGSNRGIYLGPNPRRLSAVGVDNRGAFRFANLPPGAYQVAAVDANLLNRLYDMAFLRSQEPRASRVTLTPGETARLDLAFR